MLESGGYQFRKVEQHVHSQRRLEFDESHHIVFPNYQKGSLLSKVEKEVLGLNGRSPYKRDLLGGCRTACPAY
jgi:hypothetical protein